MSLATRWVSSLRAERGCGPVPVVAPRRCLRRHPSSTRCVRCGGVCPVSAVAFSATGVSLGEGCIGCEACVVACPTDALTVPPEVVGQRRERLDAAAEVVRLTCVRQPGRGAATVTFGCLAGLPLATLLAPLTRPHRRVEVERGGCGGCDLAATGAAVAATLDRARALLTAFGIAPERIVEVDTFPREGRAQGEAVGRRELLLRLRAGAGRAVAALREEEREEGRGEAAAGAAEPQLAAVLRELGTPLVGATLPTGLDAGVVHVTGACFGCNVCETLCPTRALRRDADGAAIRLLFAPARCRGCGVCAEACLADALTVTPATGGAQPPPLSDAYLTGAEVELAVVAPRACVRCGARFTGTPGEVCDPCRTTGPGAGRLRGLPSTGVPFLPGGPHSTPPFGDGRLN